MQTSKYKRIPIIEILKKVTANGSQKVQNTNIIKPTKLTEKKNPKSQKKKIQLNFKKPIPKDDLTKEKSKNLKHWNYYYR